MENPLRKDKSDHQPPTWLRPDHPRSSISIPKTSHHPPYIFPHHQNTSNLAKATHGELQSCPLIFRGLLYASYQVSPFTWMSSTGMPAASKLALHSPACIRRVGDGHWHACSAVQGGEGGRACFAQPLGHCHKVETVTAQR